MADEIEIGFQVKLDNGDLEYEIKVGRSELKIDQTNNRLHHSVQDIGTGSHETLTLGDLTTPGYVVFRNLDSTNFVEIGDDSSGTFVPVIKLKAGEMGVIRLGTASPYAKADTAEVKLEFVIFDD